MSLIMLKTFCLPIKRSHFPFVALQAAAGMGVFGPRTVYCIALKDAPGCHEFLLQDDGKWVHVKETTEIGQYSPLALPTFLLEQSELSNEQKMACMEVKLLAVSLSFCHVFSLIGVLLGSGAK